MLQLRTAVLMKTDIVGSTPQFRALLASDLQSVLLEHRAMVARLAADEGGRILSSAGDGFWLDFPSVTGAATAAIAIQQTLQSKGRERLSMRVVIGLGDIASQDGDLSGDVLALMTRIEGITPADEIYLTSAACLALVQSEIQTAIVGSFSLKGYPEPVQVHRVEQRHRTRVFEDVWILLTDLQGFTRLTEAEGLGTVERVLNALAAIITSATTEFAGTIRFSHGDGYCVTFADAAGAMSAAERIGREWAVASLEQKFQCPINICLHGGTIYAFRSFLYGDGINVPFYALPAAARLAGVGDANVFATGVVRDALSASSWYARLQPISKDPLIARFPELEVFRLAPG